MHYFKLKLQLVSNILWMIVAAGPLIPFSISDSPQQNETTYDITTPATRETGNPWGRNCCKTKSQRQVVTITNQLHLTRATTDWSFNFIFIARTLLQFSNKKVRKSKKSLIIGHAEFFFFLFFVLFLIIQSLFNKLLSNSERNNSADWKFVFQK